MRQASLREVAAVSGVSVNTASRILRGDAEQHRPATVARVREAAEALGYRPNLPARGVLGGRTRTIGALIGFDAESYTEQLMLGLHDALVARDHAPLLLLQRPGLSALEQIHRLLDRRVDGIVVRQGAEWVTDDLLADVWKRGVPLVTLDCPISATSHADFVGNDDDAIGRLAAEHLLELGHRRLLYVHDHDLARAHVPSVRRANAFAAAAGDAECRLTKLWLGHGDAALMAQLAGVSAVACSSDLLARDVYAAAQRAGRRIGPDLAVVGAGGLTLGAWLDPPLTTLRQDGYRLGQLAAERLLARLAGDVDGEPWELRLAPELVVRASSGGPK